MGQATDELARAEVLRAREHRHARHWVQAAQAYEAAIARDDRRPGWFVALGQVHERLGQWQAARRAYASALDRDRRTTPLDRALLASSARRFPARRAMGRFVARHLEEIRYRARAVPEPVEPAEPRVWVYWAQGLDQAPEMVQLCRRELARLHEPGEVVGLDALVEPGLTGIPAHVRAKTASNRTRFSDVVRLALLARHGGVWADATCLARTRLTERTAELQHDGFFAFTYRHPRPSTWLLASTPGHDLVRMLRETEYLFWEHADAPIDYFDLHHMVEALYFLDDDVRASWDAVPRLGTGPPHALRKLLFEPYDRERVDEVLAASFVHKLTWKYDPERPREGTVLEHLLRHGPG